MGRLNHDPSIQHFSHPHPLELSNLEKQQPNFNPPPCSACKHPLSGLIYSCKTCNFNLHLSCSQKPQHINHPSDPNHPLTLLPFPPYPDGNFTCNACGLADNGFCYHCRACDLDLHIHCASMPMSLNHQAHPHTLSLNIYNPIQHTSFICDMCCKIARNIWCYECRACDFGVHVSCASNPHAQATYVRPDAEVQLEVLVQERVQVLAQRLYARIEINRLSSRGERDPVIRRPSVFVYKRPNLPF